jgi:hypothetical protein
VAPARWATVILVVLICLLFIGMALAHRQAQIYKKLKEIEKLIGQGGSDA